MKSREIEPSDPFAIQSAAAVPPGPQRQVVFMARGISKIYQMGEVQVHALREVDLGIYRGEFVVLLGPSGSGKSTLLNILGGLDRPTSGQAQFGDHNLTGATEAQLTQYRREHVGFVFQFYNLIPSLTVRCHGRVMCTTRKRALPMYFRCSSGHRIR